MSIIDSIHGLCPDCEQPVKGGEGVTVDPDGRSWHADCRRVFNRKNPVPQVIEGAAVKRGPGRPRKEVSS